MTGRDVSQTAESLDVHPQVLCWAIEVILPVLRRLREEGSGWRWWHRWGMDALIRALDEVQTWQCDA